MSVFELRQQSSPLVVSVPHDGALIPDDIRAVMNPAVTQSTDRDLHIGRIFDFEGISCSRIKANYARHVIDLNRPASGQPLYQNQPETELCPTSDFDFNPLYQPGQQPGAEEIERRTELYWRPYHVQLKALVDLAVADFGCCLLIDAHSINARVPRFFSGRLPDINVGTNDGKSCAGQLSQLLGQRLAHQGVFSYVVNGRFKGGYITRHYGQPESNVHAIQLEHSKSAYLDEQQNLSPGALQLRDFWESALRELLNELKSVSAIT